MATTSEAEEFAPQSIPLLEVRLQQQQQSLLGDFNVDTLSSMSRLTSCYSKMGDYDKASSSSSSSSSSNSSSLDVHGGGGGGGGNSLVATNTRSWSGQIKNRIGRELKEANLID